MKENEEQLTPVQLADVELAARRREADIYAKTELRKMDGELVVRPRDYREPPPEPGTHFAIRGGTVSGGGVVVPDEPFVPQWAVPNNPAPSTDPVWVERVQEENRRNQARIQRQADAAAALKAAQPKSHAEELEALKARIAELEGRVRQ